MDGVEVREGIRPLIYSPHSHPIVSGFGEVRQRW